MSMSMRRRRKAQALVAHKRRNQVKPKALPAEVADQIAFSNAYHEIKKVAVSPLGRVVVENLIPHVMKAMARINRAMRGLNGIT